MGLFGRSDEDFDEKLSKREIQRREIIAQFEEIESLRKENKKMKAFMKKENIYKKYKRKNK